jgi:hypothetical protein
MMSRSISQTTAAISQITTAITTTVIIKLNAPRNLLTSSQLKAGTPRRIPRPVGYLLIFCATAAAVGGFSLFTVLVYVADEHPAFETRTGTL